MQYAGWIPRDKLLLPSYDDDENEMGSDPDAVTVNGGGAIPDSGTSADGENQRQDFQV